MGSPPTPGDLQARLQGVGRREIARRANSRDKVLGEKALHRSAFCFCYPVKIATACGKATRMGSHDVSKAMGACSRSQRANIRRRRNSRTRIDRATVMEQTEK